MNARTKATIKRASAKARLAIKALDKETRAELKALYTQASDDIERSINAAESLDGTLQLEAKGRLLQQINARLEQLNLSRDELLGLSLRQSVEAGISPFSSIAVGLNEVADVALLQTVRFIAEDGLQLSDRLWKLNQGARQIITNEVEQAIIRGDSAVKAAREFINKSLPIPADLQRKIGQAQAHKIASTTARELMKKGSPYANALRLFRTEINRAHGEAYQAAAFESPDVIGTKFLLSPNHPETDICDMHASVNRYGLGKGVYPKGKNPWPAHPYTISFTLAVFADEVTAEDKAGKENRIDWLKKQTPARQQQVLNGRKKRAALLNDILKENQIATPWNKLKIRYKKQGIDVDNLVLPQQQKQSHIINPTITTPQPAGVKVSSIIDPVSHAGLMDYTGSQIDKVHGDGKLPFIPVHDVKSTQYLGYYDPNTGRKHIGIVDWGSQKEMTAVHELGHFIDHNGIPGNGMSSLKSKRMAEWRAAAFESESYQTIERLYNQTTDRDLKAHLKYLMKPEEVWARSYAQYIANKSGSDVMRQQLNAMRFKRPESIDIPTQWPDNDFNKISLTIDKLFIQLGWIQ